jgi:hypothetical protein
MGERKMSLDVPVLIYQAQTLRAPYARQMGFAFVFGMIALICFFPIRHLAYQNDENRDVLVLSMMFMLFLALFFGIRFIWSFIKWRRTPNERVRVYDQGIIWEKNGDLKRYSWDKIKRYRRGARVATLFDKPLWVRGEQRLWLVNGDELRFSARLDDPRQFDRVIAPIVADVTGERMGMALREKRAVKLADDLMMASGGIVAGKHKISWKTVDIQLKKNKLIIYKLGEGGKFKPLATIPAHSIDNLAGFMDVAESIIQNYQPHRFNIRTKI